MNNPQQILNKLRNKSNVDYIYYHIFNNQRIHITHNNNGFTPHYIVYMIRSDFSRFYDDYQCFKEASITDVFLERLDLSRWDKKYLFQIKFKNLFWLKLNNIQFTSDDYDDLRKFIFLNKTDINRIFLENTGLQKEFFYWLKDLNWFNTLSFINFDNNMLTDAWLNSLIYFIHKNTINLEYLSLINTWISDIRELLWSIDNIRILDLSSNNISDIGSLLLFIEQNRSIRELYLRNIVWIDDDLERITQAFETGKTNIFILRITLQSHQLKYKEIFETLSKKMNVDFDINCTGESHNALYSTLYMKQTEDMGLKTLENDYFYVLRSSHLEQDFQSLITQKNSYLQDATHLFLFDFHDYTKINLLLHTYHFNYIYLENYIITDQNFRYFLESIASKTTKKYKINLISIELSEFQLNYLIDNFPENIFYIEVNLNKIDHMREIYISRMLKNKAFIFENMELYQKIFK